MANCVCLYAQRIQLYYTLVFLLNELDILEYTNVMRIPTEHSWILSPCPVVRLAKLS